MNERQKKKSRIAGTTASFTVVVFKGLVLSVALAKTKVAWNEKYVLHERRFSSPQLPFRNAAAHQLLCYCLPPLWSRSLCYAWPQSDESSHPRTVPYMALKTMLSGLNRFALPYPNSVHILSAASDPYESFRAALFASADAQFSSRSTPTDASRTIQLPSSIKKTLSALLRWLLGGSGEIRETARSKIALLRAMGMGGWSDWQRWICSCCSLSPTSQPTQVEPG